MADQAASVAVFLEQAQDHSADDAADDQATT